MRAFVNIVITDSCTVTAGYILFDKKNSIWFYVEVYRQSGIK